jgi:hypothetical protein
MADAQKDLRAAWDDLIAELQRARDAIDQPELMPAPPTDRNLAEGYRYLAGFLHSAIERAFHARSALSRRAQRAARSSPRPRSTTPTRSTSWRRSMAASRTSCAGRSPTTATGAASRREERAGSRRST